jgi:Fic family protein
MEYLDQDVKKRIESKMGDLNRLRPLPSSAVNKLRQQFEIEMTYNSNGIEGNSLTLKETYLVISEGITVKNKPLKDHLEAKDHYEALEFIMELVEHKKPQTVSERLIRTLHQIVVKDTEKDWAGRYRNSNVIIAGAKHKPPDAIAVPLKMDELIQWFGENEKKLHTIELAALVHHKFVNIHPFFDGNGRVGRLLMNVILLRQGYPLSVVLKNDRKKYYDTLAKADEGDYVSFVRMIAQSVERSLDIYLNVLRPSKKGNERFLSLSEISPKTPYSTKYLNLLVRQGKLEAHKEGRNWLTSFDAVERYIRNRKRKRIH